MYLSRFLIKLWIFIRQILWGGTFYMDHPVCTNISIIKRKFNLKQSIQNQLWHILLPSNFVLSAIRTEPKSGCVFVLVCWSWSHGHDRFFVTVMSRMHIIHDVTRWAVHLCIWTVSITKIFSKFQLSSFRILSQILHTRYATSGL